MKANWFKELVHMLEILCCICEKCNTIFLSVFSNFSGHFFESLKTEIAENYEKVNLKIKTVDTITEIVYTLHIRLHINISTFYTLKIRADK